MQRLFIVLFVMLVTLTSYGQPALPKAPTPRIGAKSFGKTVNSFLISWDAFANTDHYEVMASTDLTTWEVLTNTIETSIVVANDAAMKYFSVSAYTVTNRSIVLSWNPSPSFDVIGYFAYYGIATRQYTNSVQSTDTSATIGGLRSGVTYFFNATAYNIFNLQSEFDGEVSYTIPFKKIVLSAKIKAM